MAAYFSPAALKFLRGLKRHNDREWFEARRATYERELRIPMLALAEEINHALADFAPDHIRPPQKAVMRIYRDVRFSSDKRPYKSQVAAWWSRSGLEKTSGAGFYFHLSGSEVTIAAGAYMPQPEQLLAIRRHLLDHHAELRTLLASRRLRDSFKEFEGQTLKRAPKGFNPEDPRVRAALDLLLCRQWGLTATLPAEVATAPELLQEIVSRFEMAAPVVHLLNAPLKPPARTAVF